MPQICSRMTITTGLLSHLYRVFLLSEYSVITLPRSEMHLFCPGHNPEKNCGKCKILAIIHKHIQMGALVGPRGALRYQNEGDFLDFA